MIRCPLYPMHCPGKASVLGLAIAIAVSFGACVGTADTFNPPPSAAEAGAERGSPNEIVQAEILSRGNLDPSAFKLIERLRPNWLRSRGKISFTRPGAGYPVVYIDAIRHGNLNTLHQMTPHQIRRIEFIRAADATIRWGTGHSGGAINIVTGR